MKNTHYISEATKFINSLLEKPGAYEKRMKLRHTWWDAPFAEREERKELNQAKLKNNSYVYFNYPHK